MTALDQHAMQFGQRLDRDLRRSQAQVRARGRVEHPVGHDNNDAWRYFDVDDFTVGPALAVLPAHAAAEQRVPAVEDLDFLPDMGGMNLRSPSEDRIGCSQDRCAPASEQRR